MNYAKNTILILVGLMSLSISAYAQTPVRVSKPSTVYKNQTVLSWSQLPSSKVLESEKTLKNSGSDKSGGVAGGGGGKLEPLFKEIASNIVDWIKSGNADLIEGVLPEDVSLTDYKTEMLRVLQNYDVTFTDNKVMVGNFEKTCRSFVDERKMNRIICNNAQFGSDTPENADNIYRQVHHEFAGLACRQKQGELFCLEENRNEISDYRISNKISAFLGVQTVIRLPIKPGIVFGESYVCSAEITGGTRQNPKSIDCGDLAVAPDLSEVTQDQQTGIFLDKQNWYRPFPSCNEVKLMTRYTSQRKLFLIVAAEEKSVPSEQTSWPHVIQQWSDASTDLIDTGAFMPSRDFVAVRCNRK